MSNSLIFTLFYILLSVCIIYPPIEFISAGLTIEALFLRWLGSENANFIQYHIKRSVITLFIHSLIPFGYILGLFLCADYDINSFYTLSIGFKFAIYLTLIPPLFVVIVIILWSKNNWNSHPICKNLYYFCNNNSNWTSVATSINIEFLRVDKICLQINSITKIVATDNWILKVNPYTIYCVNQSDAVLIVNKSDTHSLSQQNRGEVQYINIEVKSVRPGVQPFSIRLNALDFKDLQDRIARPIVILPTVTFHKTLLERFIDAFKQQVQLNPKYYTTEELEPCIGCMQTISNVKLQKNCSDLSITDTCMECHCRCMWCVECMAKWFASRQNEAESDTWLTSKCTCPLCRSKFCILDVSFVEHS